MENLRIPRKWDRPAWKTCKCCVYARYSDGGPFCAISDRSIRNIFGWKTWDECVYFTWEKMCMTCEKYENCNRRYKVRMADKDVELGDCSTCERYRPIEEMVLYTRKNIPLRSK